MLAILSDLNRALRLVLGILSALSVILAAVIKLLESGCEDVIDFEERLAP